MKCLLQTRAGSTSNAEPSKRREAAVLSTFTRFGVLASQHRRSIIPKRLHVSGYLFATEDGWQQDCGLDALVHWRFNARTLRG
jgi:hypothetical protein